MKHFAPLLVSVILAGCAGSAPNAQPPSAADVAKSTKPETSMTIKHLKEHVKYPASRGAVLAACADTPEFTAEQKKWLSDNLPERTYASADDVATALHL